MGGKGSGRKPGHRWKKTESAEAAAKVSGIQPGTPIIDTENKGLSTTGESPGEPINVQLVPLKAITPSPETPEEWTVGKAFVQGMEIMGNMIAQGDWRGAAQQHKYLADRFHGTAIPAEKPSFELDKQLREIDAGVQADLEGRATAPETPSGSLQDAKVEATRHPAMPDSDAPESIEPDAPESITPTPEELWQLALEELWPGRAEMPKFSVEVWTALGPRPPTSDLDGNKRWLSRLASSTPVTLRENLTDPAFQAPPRRYVPGDEECDPNGYKVHWMEVYGNGDAGYPLLHPTTRKIDGQAIVDVESEDEISPEGYIIKRGDR